jgi:hypothetical protein
MFCLNGLEQLLGCLSELPNLRLIVVGTAGVTFTTLSPSNLFLLLVQLRVL